MPALKRKKNLTPLSRQSGRKSKDNLVHRRTDSLRRNSTKNLRKLRARSAVLENILRESPAAILLVDSITGKILEINQAAEKILEISGGGAPDNSFHVRNIFVQRSEFDSLQKEILDQKKVMNRRCDLRTTGREWRVAQICASAIVIDGKSCIIFNFSDISDMSSAERFIANYHNKILNMERALDASSLVSITDVRGTIIYANPKFCEISEYSRDELLGENHKIVNSGYHSPEFIRNLWQTINGGNIWHGEIRNQKKGGDYYWVDSTIIPFLDKSGKPYQFYSIRHDISSRKEYEEELERSGQALIQAQELARLGSWEWRSAEDRATWSNEMYRIYGVSRDAGPLTFREIPEYYTIESWNALQSAVAKTLELGHLFNLECNIIRKDSTRITVIASGAPLHNTHGEIIGICGTVQDITDRKMSEERNRLIVNALPDLLFIVDKSGVFLDYHASDQRRLAFPPEQFLGKSFVEIFPAELATRMTQALMKTRQQTQPVIIEYALPMRDTMVYYEASFSVLDPDRSMAVVRDITERKNAEERLHEQATLLDKASDAIIVKSIDHQIHYWNKAAERMYGWKSAEVLGRSTGDILYGDRSEFDAAINMVMSNGEFSGELHQKTKDGNAVIVHARWTLLRDEAGKPKSVLCITSDITERKKLEQQFLRAQRLESIGTLAGGIAHDLNNVLTPIMLAAELLKTSNLPPEQMDLIAMIETSVNHGTRMVRQVLSFARGAEGNPLPMRVQNLFKDLEPIIRDTFPRNIMLEISVEENLWSVKGDFTQLHQVLMNLLVNARDAMPSGGKLFVSARNRILDAQYAGMQIDVSPGNYIVIQLEDSGLGMSKEVLERIFDPFYTTKEHGKGTGLGLSTSLAIVKAHGGFVRVYSEPGQGTKFHIYLPALPAGTQTSLVTESKELPRGNGELILVVDDESSVLEVTKQTLEAFGYATKTADDGADAIVVFAEFKDQICLVLTDMMMPVLDGAGAIQVILKMKPNLPIIAVSGLDAQGKTLLLHDKGNIHFLQKPYTAATLLQRIRNALKNENELSK